MCKRTITIIGVIILAVVLAIVVMIAYVVYRPQLNFGQADQAQASGLKATFVPRIAALEVNAAEAVPIQSHYISPDGLDTLEIFINGQPVAVEGAEGFPPGLATVRPLIEGQPVLTHTIRPIHPTTAWTVSVLWEGYVPGSYRLEMQITDRADHQEKIEQLIEVR